MIHASAYFLITLLFAATGCAPQTKQFEGRNPHVITHPDALTANLAAIHEAAAKSGEWYECVGTASMEPLIIGQAYLVAVRVPYADLRVGDVVNYRPEWTGGRLTVHRLVSRDGGGFIASGDNNRWSESYERVTEAKYVDKVITIHSYVGVESTRIK